MNDIRKMIEIVIPEEQIDVYVQEAKDDITVSREIYHDYAIFDMIAYFEDYVINNLDDGGSDFDHNLQLYAMYKYKDLYDKVFNSFSEKLLPFLEELERENKEKGYEE